jgi:hypothetical protein
MQITGDSHGTTPLKTAQLGARCNSAPVLSQDSASTMPTAYVKQYGRTQTEPLHSGAAQQKTAGQSFAKMLGGFK